MDEIAHADGDVHQDLRRDEALQGESAARYEIKHAALVAVSDDLEAFNANYMHLTETISQTCQDILDDEAVIVGTSAVTGTELDSIVNQYSGIYNNPFLAWGRYRKGWLKTTLPISFQFHHAQMDGSHAARFLEELQKKINTI